MNHPNLDFPLFAAPARDAVEYRGRGVCAICGNNVPDAFEAHAGVNIDCIIACRICLQSGRAFITHNTEVGLVGPKAASLGADAVGVRREVIERHGFPICPHPVEPKDPKWMLVKLPPDDVAELCRTPTFVTFQGCRWLFCCSRAMTFIGTWKESEFEAHGGADPGGLFCSSVDGYTESSSADWPPYAPLSGAGGPYMFRCRKCNKYRGYIDMP